MRYFIANITLLNKQKRKTFQKKWRSMGSSVGSLFTSSLKLVPNCVIICAWVFEGGYKNEFYYPKDVSNQSENRTLEH